MRYRNEQNDEQNMQSRSHFSTETVPCAALSLIRRAFNNPYLKAIELPQLPLDPNSEPSV